MQWLAGLDVRGVLLMAAVLMVTRAGLVRSRRLPVMLRDTLTQIAEVSLVSLVVVFLIIHRFLFQLFFIPSGSMIPTLAIQDRIIVNKWAYRAQSPKRGEVVVFRAPRAASEEPCDFIKRIVGLPGETVRVVPDTLCLDGRPLAPIILASEARSLRDGLLVPDEADLRVCGNRLRVNGTTVLLAATGGKVQQVGRALTVDGRIEYVAEANETLRQRPLRVRTDGVHGEGTVVSGTSRERLTVVIGKRLSLVPGFVSVNGRRLQEPYLKETPRYAMAPIRLGTGRYLVLGDNRNNSKDSHFWGALDGSRIVGRAEAICWPQSRARWLGGDGENMPTGVQVAHAVGR
jgi:signal peptidase I